MAIANRIEVYVLLHPRVGMHVYLDELAKEKLFRYENVQEIINE
jgi:hypothetical protein